METNMRTHDYALGSRLVNPWAVLAGLWLVGCSPSPPQDALGWNGRGMPLPVDTGEAGTSGGGADGVTTGAAGAAGVGAAGAGAGRGGAAGGGMAGAGSPLGAAGGGGQTASGGAPGTGAAGSGGGNGGASPPGVDGGLQGPLLSTTCHLDVTVTTHSGGGSHAPKNVDAIWIQDAGGKFVKSLYVMARNEIQHLNAWNTATSAVGLARNRVDAVTGATLPGYGTRTASWNCTDVKQQARPAGGYQVCFDLNDGNGSDKHTCDSITLGNVANMVKPPDALPSFTGRSLTYTP
jgi:hypothetical protein